MVLACLIACMSPDVWASGVATGQENVTSSSAAFERQVFALTNLERKTAGLPALEWNESLARAARYHAASMAALGYFDHFTHVKKNGRLTKTEDPGTRGKKFFHGFCGENIAYNQPSPQDVMRCWMESPGHRANILRKGISQLGVGYVRGMWVQNFGF